MSDDANMGVTGNAILLLGFIAGTVTRDGSYEIISVDAARGAQTVKHAVTGNLYRVSVVQLEGVE